MLRRSMNNDPAELLDPDGDFDSELTALLP